MSDVNASEARRFIEGDFARLEIALNDVREILGGGSRIEYAAVSNWEYIAPHFRNPPPDIFTVFDAIIEVRNLARCEPMKLTGEQLLAAKRGIVEILDFLHRQFPLAGVI